MAINLTKPSLNLIAEYVSGSEYVKFFEGGIVQTLFDNEFEAIEQTPEFFDFVLKTVPFFKNYNVVDNWQEINDCFSLFDEMSDNQKVLFDLVLCDYSFYYDLPTLTNYCLENACLFDGSASDYAYELIHDCYDVKSIGTLANYIDYEGFAHDMILNSEIIELSYNLYWTNPNDIH